jgi:TonB family protein
LFSSLPSGPYNVEFEAKGFERTLQENVQVKTGQTVGLNIKLRVGGENTTLTIKDKPLVAAAAPPTPPPPAASAGKPVGPQRVSSGVIVGNLISKVDPVYPDDAKRAHLQGTVVLVALIAKDGTVKDVQAEDGPPRLMVSAIDAVRQWRYKPSLLNGEPTEVNTVIRIEFKLDDASATVRPGSTEVAQAEQEYRDTLSAIHAAKKVGGGVSAPMPIYQVEPEYSEEAKQAKFMGIVLVGLVVDANGSPQDVHVVRGVGLGLNDKAIEAVKQYKFKPAMEDGKPVAAQINIEVNFKIF